MQYKISLYEQEILCFKYVTQENNFWWYYEKSWLKLKLTRSELNSSVYLC